VCDRNYSVTCGNSGIPNATLFHRRENHRGGGKELLPVTLDKGDRGGTEAYNNVWWVPRMERTQILDE